MTDVFDTDQKCAKCGSLLFRITDAENDTIVCTSCAAFGDFKEVVENGAGLISDPSRIEVFRRLDDQIRLARKKNSHSS